jgi:hypothetical protein
LKSTEESCKEEGDEIGSSGISGCTSLDVVVRSFFEKKGNMDIFARTQTLLNERSNRKPLNLCLSFQSTALLVHPCDLQKDKGTVTQEIPLTGNIGSDEDWVGVFINEGKR